MKAIKLLLAVMLAGAGVADRVRTSEPGGTPPCKAARAGSVLPP